MISKEDCYLLGRIRKTTGFTGELMITIDLDLREENLDFEFLHLELDGSLIPFFIDEMYVSNPKTIKVSFLDVATQEKARKLIDSLVYVEKSQLPEETESSLLSGIEGYAVIDKTAGEIGKADSILQNPGQDLLLVIHKEKEILIPIVEEIILSVNQKKKVIHVDLPEGLLDLNE